MDMISEEFVTALELTAGELEETLASWTTYDSELRAEYADQIEGLLVSATTVPSSGEHALRIARAVSKFFEARAAVEQIIGIPPDLWLTASVSGTPEGSVAYDPRPTEVAQAA